MLRGVAATLTAAALFVACQAVAPTQTLITTAPRATPLTTSPPGASSAAHPTPSQANRTPAPAVTLSVGPVPEGQTQAATVVHVTDGDTIRVEIEGTEYRLRYIGMDTPETVDPDKPVQPGGAEASARNSELVTGKTVYLEKDASETDRFGRLLRYVWLSTDAGWVLVNRQLVLEGLAYARDYPPDTAFHDILFSAQAEARAAGRGLWAPAFNSPRPTTGGVGLYRPGATPTPQTQCDPSYPTLCIPPPPPDLDCSDIPYRRFTVLPPDPDHFDGDHNGIGCEAVATP